MSDDNNLVESSVIDGNFGCMQHKQLVARAYEPCEIRRGMHVE